MLKLEKAVQLLKLASMPNLCHNFLIRPELDDIITPVDFSTNKCVAIIRHELGHFVFYLKRVCSLEFSFNTLHQTEMA